MAFFSPKRGAAGSARPKTTKLPPPTASEDDEDTISSSTISLQLESTVTSSVRPENRQNNAVALPIKTPLSPKRTNLRKRHSSAEDETESLSMMSHVETASSAGGDQSDLEIRVNTLQEDLSRRMKTAARLKKEQKSARRERLKVRNICCFFSSRYLKMREKYSSFAQLYVF